LIGSSNALLLCAAIAWFLTRLFFQLEKAIDVYEQAFRKNQKDSTLASKIGQTLIKTHDYKKVKLAFLSTA